MTVHLPPSGHKLSDHDLFVETLLDLQARTRLNARSYDLLSVPFLLRRLLLDNTPLVHRVNRAARMHPTYAAVGLHIPVPLFPSGELVWCTREYIDPDAAYAFDQLSYPGLPARGRVALRRNLELSTHHLTLEKFLSFPVVRGGSLTSPVTAGDLIRYHAYQTGSLHKSESKTQADEVLASLPSYKPDELPQLDLVEQMIVGVGRVVVRGLLPLAQALDGHYVERRHHKSDIWRNVSEEALKHPDFTNMNDFLPAQVQAEMAATAAANAAAATEPEATPPANESTD